MKWEGYVALIGKIRHQYKNIVGKLEGKIPFRIRRRRWEIDNKVDRKEVDLRGDVDWIHLTQVKEQ
jgi:hypothetical protein